MQDNLHFFELEIYEIIREDYVRFLRKSTKENLALHDILQLFRFNKKQYHKLLYLSLFICIEKVNIRPNHQALELFFIMYIKRSNSIPTSNYQFF